MLNVGLSDNVATAGGAVMNEGVADLQNLSVRGNSATSSGGGISNSGSATLGLAFSFFVNNTAGGFGGGLENTGTATIFDSRFFENSASSTSGVGGGLYHNGGTTSVTFSELRGGAAQDGAGLYAIGGTLNVSNSLIWASVASRNGGGAFLDNPTSATFINTTFSGNSAVNGGGLHTLSQELATLRNVTVTANTASGLGGGIRGIGASLFNTIVAANNGPTDPDISGIIFSGTHNVIGVPAFNTFTDGANGNKVGSVGSPLNPLLGPLADNGPFSFDPIKTHALLAGSPAIDGGTNTGAPEIDQRGFARPKDGDGNTTDVTDIGAVEAFLGAITGLVYHDRDGDRVRDLDGTEPVLRGFTVYADLNNNGQLDEAEPRTESSFFDDLSTPAINEIGAYKLFGLDPGTVKLRGLPPLGFESTTTFPLTFTLSPGQQINNVDIGSRFVNVAPVLADTNVSALLPLGTSVTQDRGVLVQRLLGGATDVNANALQGIAVTAVNTSQGTWQFSLDDAANWEDITAVAGLGDANALLLPADVLTRVRFRPNGGVSGTINNALTFRAWDRTEGSIGGTFDARVNGLNTAFSSATDSASVTLTATFFGGGGDGVNWSDAANWSNNTLPAIGGDVYLDLAGESATVTNGLTVRNIQSEEAITAQTGALTVTGLGRLFGPVAVRNGGVVEANGSVADLFVAQTDNSVQGLLTATSGGRATFAGLTAATTSNVQGFIAATNSGSVLNLPDLVSASASSLGLGINANGGTLNAPRLASLSGEIQLHANSGGVMNLPALQSINNATILVDANTTLDLPQVASLNSVALPVSGTNAILDLSSATTLTATNGRGSNWTVSGTGARLDFSGLQSLSGAEGNEIQASVSSGGALDLSQVDSITGNVGVFVAHLNSTVNLTDLDQLQRGTDNSSPTLEALIDGQLRLNPGTTTVIDDASITGFDDTVLVGALEVAAGATLRSGGLVTGQLVNRGVLDLQGTLMLTGNFTQTATGKLQVGSSTTAFERLAISGSATLDGELGVSSRNGPFDGADDFNAASNSVHSVVMFGSRIGDFATRTQDPAGGHRFVFSSDANSVDLLTQIFIENTSDEIDAVPGDGIAKAASGVSSLRSAIIEANAFAGHDTIVLAAGTYTLTLAGTNEEAAATGDLDIKDDVTIIGASAGLTFIDAADLDRVFDVKAGKKLRLEGVTVRNGHLAGGADGGGILNSGTLELVGVTLDSNDALSSVTAQGGAIYNQGALTITDSSLTNNTSNGAGGGLFNLGGHTATISNTTFDNNTSTARSGGAIDNDDNATLTVSNSTFTNNSASNNGGAITNPGGTATISNSLFDQNSVSTGTSGGGVSNLGDGVMTITASAFTRNSGQGGSAILNSSSAQLTVTGSSITNHSSAGSTVSSSSSGVFTITNSTISGNTTSAGSTLGTISHSTGSLVLINNTITNNAVGTSTSAGGVFINGGTATLRNNVLTATVGNRADVVGDFISEGGNFIGNVGTATGITQSTDRTGTSGSPLNALLGPLVNYGGPVRTGALQSAITSGSTQLTLTSASKFPNLPSFTIKIDSEQLLVTAVSGTTITVTRGVNGTTAASHNANTTVTLLSVPNITTPAFHSPLVGSPLIEAGVNGVGGTTDQRGAARTLDANGDGVATTDIGAVEFSFFVTTTADTRDANPGDGIAADASGQTSLRAAIMEANALAEHDVIYVSSGTYTLTRAGANEEAAATGDLDIVGELTLVGEGAITSIVDGNSIDRVFEQQSGSRLVLHGVTVRNGKTSATEIGGGLFANGLSTHVIDSRFENNTASSGGGLASYATGSTVLVEGSTFTGNTASGSSISSILDQIGSGLFAGIGTVDIRGSTFTGNSGARSHGAVGVGVSATVSIVDSTLADNLSDALVIDGGRVTVTRSTISGNNGTNSSPSRGGGGITGFGPDLTVIGSTISGNLGAQANGLLTLGGTVVIQNSTISSTGTSVFADYTNGGMSVRNSIVVGTIDARSTLTSLGNNLISAFNGVGVSNGVNGDIVGTVASPVDAKLGALADNGGPTKTHALLATSPAIDAGEADGVMLTDQRGLPRSLDGNDDGIPRPDIGAFERFVGFLVNSTLDTVDANPGDGIAADSMGRTTLRAAIMEANAHAGRDSIVVPAGTYLFTLAGTVEDAAATGDLDITGDLTITGLGATATIIDAADLDRIFDVKNGATLRLEGVTLRNGQIIGDGGAILNSGTLDLVGLTLDSNLVTGSFASQGGAIYNQGTLTIADSALTNNEAQGEGGALFNADGFTASITNSTFNNNRSQNSSGGAIDSGINSTLNIVGSSFTNNSAFGGGAIYNRSGTVSIASSLFGGNSSLLDGGALFNASGGSLTIDRSTLQNNSATTVAGGLYNIGQVTITRSTFKGNTATQGAAISNNDGAGTFDGLLTISQSLFVGNTATNQEGGAIDNNAGAKLNAENSTFSDNSATEGGAIFNSNLGQATLTHVTITQTTSGINGGGLHNNSSASEVVVKSSVIAGLPGGTPGADLVGAFTSLGHNFTGDKGTATGFANAVNGDQVGTSAARLNPQLGPLASNGGPTQTHVPLRGSPLIEAGVNGVGGATDQRGAGRELDGNGDGIATADIGAVEFAFFVTTTADTVDANPGDGLARDANGQTSLRAAIMEANALAGYDVISVPAGTYRITRLTGGNSGDFDINSSLSIVGAGAAATIIDARPSAGGTASTRVFDISASAVVTLAGLTVSGGLVDGFVNGGGITNAGDVTLRSVVVRDNRSTFPNGAGALGGGVYSSGSLQIFDSEFRDNLAGNGGGVYAVGALEVRDSLFTRNNALRSGGGSGGGLAADFAVTIVNSVFTQNMATRYGGGAAIGGPSGSQDGAIRTIQNSTFDGNTALDGGGGLLIGNPIATVSSSTFSNNVTGSHTGPLGGGGILVTDGTLLATNITVSGNSTGSSAPFGGGLRVFRGVATVDHATITGNTGGGVEAVSGGTVNLRNSIVTGNSATSNPNVSGTVTSGGHNLIGVGNGATGFTHGVNGDQVGTSATPLNAQFGLLADNGGVTKTHALLAMSPAIDAGAMLGTESQATIRDQRGVPRPQGAAPDIGAFEVGANLLFVNSTADSVDASPGDGIVADAQGRATLRAAIMESNTLSGVQTIVIPAGTYRLAAGADEAIEIAGDLDVLAEAILIGDGSGETIVEGNGDRVFDLHASAGAVTMRGLQVRGGGDSETGAGGGIRALTYVTLRDLVITGNQGGLGGGLYVGADGGLLEHVEISQNSGPGGGAGVFFDSLTFESEFPQKLLRIEDSWIHDNATLNGLGGGLHIRGGRLELVRTRVSSNSATEGGGLFVSGIGNTSAETFVVQDSLFDQNSASERGGAIYNFDSGDTSVVVELVNTTLAGNSAVLNGGAVHAVGGRVDLTNVTVAENSTLGDGGGLSWLGNGGYRLLNTVVTDNSAGTPSTSNLSANAFVSLGHNFISALGNATGFANGVNGDLVGTTLNPLDAKLGPLSDNGGPTLTMLPRLGSPLIDAGDNTGASATDQRGAARVVDGNNDSTATIDIGAVERVEGANRGRVFYDANGNALTDAGDRGLAGRTVFLDADEDGVLDTSELRTVTLADNLATSGIDEAGTYEFEIVAPGDIDVRTLIVAGEQFTTPSGGVHEATVVSGQLSFADFGLVVPLTITDLSSNPASVSGITEGDAGQAILTFRAELPAAAPVDVSFLATITGGAATVGTDVVERAVPQRTIVITAGQTSVDWSYAVPADSTDEFDETIVVTISNVTNALPPASAMITGVILDNDAPPTVSIGDAQLVEGDRGPNTLMFPVTLSAPSGKPVSVTFTVAAGTASAGVDFVAAAQPVMVSFAPGVTSATALVNLVTDFTDEADETLTVTLGEPINVTIADGQATGTILDDDINLTVTTDADKIDQTAGDGVVNTGVANEITLRAAVMTANQLAGDDEIVLPAGTFTFTLGTRSEDAAASGDLDVTSGYLRIRGTGTIENPSIIDAADLDRVFHVRNGATLELINVTLRNGDLGDSQDGGAIAVDASGTLILTQTKLENHTARTGGALFLLGNSTLTVSQATFTGNTASGATSPGGAIATSGSGIVLNVADSTFRNNTAVTGGGAIFSTGTLTVTDSTFESNRAEAVGSSQSSRGGAIFSSSTTMLSIESSTFSQNSSISRGSGQSTGGAVAADTSTTVTITSSTFERNVATAAAGATGTIRVGGGLWTRGTATITNSTFSANTADFDGGGMFDQTGTLSLNHVTIARNVSGRNGGGVAVAIGTANIKDSLIATNTATTSNPDVHGTFVSQGHNLIGNRGTVTSFVAGQNGDLVGESGAVIDPRLLDLADNGGPTKTHALEVRQIGVSVVFSPAVDAGDNSGAPQFDQRGLPRDVDGRDLGTATPDIGAYELPRNRMPSLAAQTFNVAENTSMGSLIGRVVFSDLDGNLRSPALSITEGDQDHFEFIAATGDLKVKTPLDFEFKASYSLKIRATDTGVSLTDTADDLFREAFITINVTNTNEQPELVGSGLDNRSRRDGDETETVDLRPLFVDPDNGDTLTFTLVGNTNPELVDVRLVNGGVAVRESRG